MADENADALIEDAQLDAADDQSGEPQKPEKTDLRGMLRAAFDEHRDKDEKPKSEARSQAAQQRQRDETGKFASNDAAGAKDRPSRDDALAPKAEKSKPVTEAAPDKATPEADKQVSATTEVKSDAAVPIAAGDPPSSWSKEAKTAWTSLPAAVQQAALKREQEVADGFKQYQTRYGEIERVLAPVRPLLQQSGHSDASAIQQLFSWHAALAGPQKLQAFQALAQAHGIDLSTLAPRPSTGEPQEEDSLTPRLQPIMGEVGNIRQAVASLASQMAEGQNARVNAEIAAFAKDKPHFEQVRVQMGQLMASGVAQNLDDAYQQAVWANPETRAAILQEEAAKRDAAAQAAAEAERKKAEEAEAKRKRDAAEAAAKARRAASVNVRGGPPSGASVNKPAKPQSVRESIQAALDEART